MWYLLTLQALVNEPPFLSTFFDRSIVSTLPSGLDWSTLCTDLLASTSTTRLADATTWVTGCGGKWLIFLRPNIGPSLDWIECKNWVVEGAVAIFKLVIWDRHVTIWSDKFLKTSSFKHNEFSCINQSCRYVLTATGRICLLYKYYVIIIKTIIIGLSVFFFRTSFEETAT